jgi:hypothetical protein
MRAKPEALVIFPYIERWHAELGNELTVHFPPVAEREVFIRAHGPRIRALLTNGSVGASAELMDKLPALEIVACFSAGYENIDLAAAAARRIPVTTGPGVNAASTADLAFALMLAAVRRLTPRDRDMRAGAWSKLRALTPTITGKRLGLLGLGHVGKALARRGAGFDMALGYCKPTRADDVAYEYFATPEALAAWCDILVVCCPGGAPTHHIVDAQVLAALGHDGYVVNISRGSVIDTDALLAALAGGAIAGAGLDVFEDEPTVPAALLRRDDVVLSPHVAGFTQEAFRAGFDLLRDNLRAHFAGRPLLSPLVM